MEELKREYERAIEDIELYYKHLEELEKQVNYSQLPKILKANLFLMLYNIIESIVTKSLELIHDKINSEKVKYKDCIDEIKALWIEFEHSKFEETKSLNIIKKLTKIDDEILYIEYEEYSKKKRSNISGNLDARKIREISNVYLLEHNQEIIGKKLVEIKNTRNRLAHGEISFSELGGNYTSRQMFEYYRECKEYLKEYISNVETYIREKKYKKLTI